MSLVRLYKQARSAHRRCIMSIAVYAARPTSRPDPSKYPESREGKGEKKINCTDWYKTHKAIIDADIAKLNITQTVDISIDVVRLWMQSLKEPGERPAQAKWLARQLLENGIINQVTYDFFVNCYSLSKGNLKHMFALNFFYNAPFVDKYLSSIIHVTSLNQNNLGIFLKLDPKVVWQHLNSKKRGRRKAQPRSKKEEEEDDENTHEEEEDEDDEEEKSVSEQKRDKKFFKWTMIDKDIRRQLRELSENEDEEPEIKKKRSRPNLRGRRVKADSDEESGEESEHGSDSDEDPFDPPGGAGAFGRGAPPPPARELRPARLINYADYSPTQAEEDIATHAPPPQLPQQPETREPLEDTYILDSEYDLLFGKTEKAQTPPSELGLTLSDWELAMGDAPSPIHGWGASQPNPQQALITDEQKRKIEKQQQRMFRSKLGLSPLPSPTKSKELTEPNEPFQPQDTNRLGLIAATTTQNLQSDALQQLRAYESDSDNEPPIDSLEDWIDNLSPPSTRMSRMAARFSSMKL